MDACDGENSVSDDWSAVCGDFGPLAARLLYATLVGCAHATITHTTGREQISVKKVEPRLLMSDARG